MDLKFAQVKSVLESSYTILSIESGEEYEARRSGPVTSLGIDPEPGQLVAVDFNIQPPEIVHVYPQSDPVNMSAEIQKTLQNETFPTIIARHTASDQPVDLTEGARYMSWTGLAAEVWDPSGGDEPQKDHGYLKRVIEKNGGPALDVGCGTGRLLLRYRSAGLDVDGLDTSADMLTFCREKAASLGLEVNLYEQSMHELDLPRRYRTIFIPCGTFCLLIHREDAIQALERMHQHLQPGGELVFNLFWEYGPGGLFWNQPDGKWHRMFYSQLPDGKLVFQYIQTEKIDRVEQQYFGRRRYQLVSEGQVIKEEVFPSYERLYGKHEIKLMLEQTGFGEVVITGDWTAEPFREGHGVMVIHGRK